MPWSPNMVEKEKKKCKFEARMFAEDAVGNYDDVALGDDRTYPHKDIICVADGSKLVGIIGELAQS